MIRRPQDLDSLVDRLKTLDAIQKDLNSIAESLGCLVSLVVWICILLITALAVTKGCFGAETVYQLTRQAPAPSPTLGWIWGNISNRFHRGDITTRCHEDCHELHSLYRQKVGGHRAALFLPFVAQVAAIQQPPVSCVSCGRNVPSDERLERYRLYCIRQAADWNDSPLMLGDEAFAYLAGAACGVEVRSKEYDYGIYGAVEFQSYFGAVLQTALSSSYDRDSMRFLAQVYGWYTDCTKLVLEKAAQAGLSLRGADKLHDKYLSRYYTPDRISRFGPYKYGQFRQGDSLCKLPLTARSHLYEGYALGDTDMYAAVLLLAVGQADPVAGTRLDIRVQDPSVRISTSIRTQPLTCSLPRAWSESATRWYQRYTTFRRGEEYSIIVSCPTRSKVGIAVDGRSVLSPDAVQSGVARFIRGPYNQLSSWKTFSSDRLYVMGPGYSNEVRGWREGDTIRRFVATTPSRSLSSAWGTEEAAGTIIVAIFPEVTYQPYYGKSYGAGPAGTGSGTREYSPVQTVQFESAQVASEVYLVRYQLSDVSYRETYPYWNPRAQSPGVYIGPLPERW